MPRKLREENGVALPKRVWRVIDQVRGGQKLCKFRTGAETIEFVLEPRAIPIAPKAANAAIASGLLRPQGDGLFGADTSQTWVAA